MKVPLVEPFVLWELLGPCDSVAGRLLQMRIGTQWGFFGAQAELETTYSKHLVLFFCFEIVGRQTGPRQEYLVLAVSG